VKVRENGFVKVREVATALRNTDVSFRQGCMNSAEDVGIVGCPLTHSGRRTADERRNDICSWQSTGPSSGAFRALA
jgi:hypothetical protein